MLNNQFELCPKCKATNIDSLIPKLKELDPNAKIITRCIGFCGIGREKIVIIVNHLPVIGLTEDEVIEKVKQQMKKV